MPQDAAVSRVDLQRDHGQARHEEVRMPHNTELLPRIQRAVNRDRLLDTAMKLCAVYSPTGNAGEVSDRLAEILAADGFEVERPDGGWPAAPAVVARYETGRPGRTLQFDGHLDTVHLPFVPPAVAGDRLTGSGSSDMKGGVAAAVEALRAIRDAELIRGGAILFTAHDLHEAPWGDGSQLDRMIADGIVGDAVLIPEYLATELAVIGRGQATWKVTFRRAGAPVHEVYRPLDEPSVIAAGAALVARLEKLDLELSAESDPLAGRESVFIGQVHSGEIYNQYPQECWLEGTRRWLSGRRRADAERDFRVLVDEIARERGVTAEVRFMLVRDAFRLPLEDPLVAIFDDAITTIHGQPLPRAGKRFVDDGSSFWHGRQIAAITHGPVGGGAHTLEEWISIDSLVRVAETYALVAAGYCQAHRVCL